MLQFIDPCLCRIVLARYGADVEMNTSAFFFVFFFFPPQIKINFCPFSDLFLEPALAKADMDLKVGFQKKQLESKLTVSFF